MVMSLSHLLPIGGSLAYRDGTTSRSCSLSMAIVNFAAGYVMWLATRTRRRELQPRDGFLLVVAGVGRCCRRSPRCR